jgi:putative NADPH-quinone reductase
MKILVINGSPKGERSDTMKLTRAFLRGMGEDAEVIDTIKAAVKPCLGCYACWYKTPGKCIQDDGSAAIIAEIRDADLVIWSAPLYCYSLPSNCKALLDRLLPLSTPVQYTDENGHTHHPGRADKFARQMLISGCGFPDREGNYDALIFLFHRMFGNDSPMILCVESPLLSIPEAVSVTEPYLAHVEEVGGEFKAAGCITAETQRMLDAPMYPPDEYRKNINQS